MDVVKIQEHTIAYREAGTGPPIVFLHGWPLDSREFSYQLGGLSDAFQVVAWDAPGAGGSTDPEEGASLSDWADWLAEFIESLELVPCHVAGLSFGGGLALAFAQRHPVLVRSLTLMSAYAGWGGSLTPEETRRRLELTIGNTHRPPAEWVPALIDTLLPAGSDEQLAKDLDAMLSDLHPAATRVALTAFAEADLRAGLPDLDIPTLMLYGTKDVRSPREVWEPIHEAIPRSKIILIPEVGHMVDMQAPERCNAEIRAFIDEIQAVVG